MARMCNSPTLPKIDANEMEEETKSINQGITLTPSNYKSILSGQFTCKLGKPMPTTKFAIQLTSTAMAMALGRGPCENSSAVIIHGIEPGPTAKNTTNASVDITDK